VSQQLGLVETAAIHKSFRPRLMTKKELVPFPSGGFLAFDSVRSQQNPTQTFWSNRPPLPLRS
jgi:hypothetical protein